MSKPKKVSDSGRTPMDAALRFLVRARTVREVERHLDACEYGEVEVYETVERLKDLGLLNDAAYAEEFVRTRLATKPISRAHLREQLLAHEVEAVAIDQALLQVDDETQQKSAGSIAEKYVRQYAHLSEDERNEIVVRRLLARGYSYDDARAALREATGENIE
ncbi:MAG: RecX family transcriptional regulator [Clostridiaceae bacterium]